MGSVGDAYYNPMAESFFASLECELLDDVPSRARVARFSYIEGWYNPRRRHAGLGRIAPAECERRHAIQINLSEDPANQPRTRLSAKR